MLTTSPRTTSRGIIATRSQRIGYHKRRGLPRFYAEGRAYAQAQFAPGTPLRVMATADGAVEITATAGATSIHVSAKSVRGSDAVVPLLEVIGGVIADVFAAGDAIRVIVSDQLIRLEACPMAVAQAGRPSDGTHIGCFAGGGLLTQAAVQAGFTPVADIEIDARYAEILHANHPSSHVLNMSVHEALTVSLPSPELMTMGVPCESWSTARTTERGVGSIKRDRAKVSTDHELGDLAWFAFALITKLAPRTVALECSPAFGASETGEGMRRALIRGGYVVDVAVVNAADHGGRTRRKRTVLIAQTPAPDGSTWNPWPTPAPATTPIRDVLDTDVPEDKWFTPESKAWLFAHNARHAEKGNGFKMVILDLDAPTTTVIRKRYFAQQTDTVVVPHPTKPDTYRWFTVSEVKRLMGLHASYELGSSTTTAGEILGQGVDVTTFTSIIAHATGRAATATRRMASAPAVCLADDEGDDAEESCDVPDTAPVTPARRATASVHSPAPSLFDAAA